MIIKCRFLDNENVPKGREYTYGSHEEVAVGEIVTTSEGKKLVVTSDEVPQEESEKYGENLKYVASVIDIGPESITIEDEAKVQELITVKQLPIIEERLKSLSDEIEIRVNTALALPCTEDNIKVVKSDRADLKKIFESLERQRIEVKNAIMNPYEQFNNKYKIYISDKLKSADNTLKKRISDVENELKDQKEESVKLYFNEYLSSKDIDFVSYEDAKINITLTASLKSLKEQAKVFIEHVSDEVALIVTQEHKEEILVEYKKSLNCAQAITTVVTRHKAIEEQKARQAELEAKKQAEQEHVKAVEKVANLTAPVVTKPEPQAEKKYSAAFKVTGTLEELREIKRFLEEGGYKYEC
ncbi:MAG TPA: hypothetical protein DIC60_01190 [Lachnospiraceae bacterium]|nr:hypothetical protein [Lachnospiraceae bacterium]